MKKATRFFGVVVLLISALAWAAGAGVSLNTANRLEALNCAAGGTSGPSVNPGKYLLTVTDEDTWFCRAAACASGGTRLPVGFGILIQMGANGTTGFPAAESTSCRSTGSTGDLTFTPAD